MICTFSLSGFFAVVLSACGPVAHRSYLLNEKRGGVEKICHSEEANSRQGQLQNRHKYVSS